MILLLVYLVLSGVVFNRTIIRHTERIESLDTNCVLKKLRLDLCFLSQVLPHWVIAYFYSILGLLYRWCCVLLIRNILYRFLCLNIKSFRSHTEQVGSRISTLVSEEVALGSLFPLSGLTTFRILHTFIVS